MASQPEKQSERWNLKKIILAVGFSIALVAAAGLMWEKGEWRSLAGLVALASLLFFLR